MTAMRDVVTSENLEIFNTLTRRRATRSDPAPAMTGVMKMGHSRDCIRPVRLPPVFVEPVSFLEPIVGRPATARALVQMACMSKRSGRAV
jgi:hypothetical protein